VGTSTTFAQPQLGVAPGQTLAWYDGDRVMGSGTITRTRAAVGTLAELPR